MNSSDFLFFRVFSETAAPLWGSKISHKSPISIETNMVEVEKSIYALWAKKTNKMKKADRKIQWANLACWISRLASFDRC
jgi:hypothetical protein